MQADSQTNTFYALYLMKRRNHARLLERNKNGFKGKEGIDTK